MRNRHKSSSRRKQEPRKVIRQQVALTISDLRKVRRETYGACSKWYDIGVELEVPHETLQCIKSDHPQDTNSCFRVMYSHWLKMVDPKPTWELLASALEQPVIGECDLAANLRKKHNCPSMERHSPPVGGSSSAVEQRIDVDALSYLWRQKALTFIWNHKLLLIALVVILGLQTVYIAYNYYDASVDPLSTAMNRPAYKFSRTLPRGYESYIFFGRDVELKKLTELIKPTSQACIISITGSPGFGKSTLAIHAGYQAENLDYTVVYADIAEVDLDNIHLVKEEITKRVNLEEAASFNEITDWAKSNRTLTSVLILDNCDSVLHEHSDDFKGLLKAVCRDSKAVHVRRDSKAVRRDSNSLKVIITTKQEILLLGNLLEHIQVNELQTKDAVRVLRGISDRINITFARKLAKHVGNVPLALQIVGTLLKDNARGNQEVFLDIQNDIIEALSPEELPVEERVKTSLNVSYHYLPEKFQICGRILSKFPEMFSRDSAHHVLSNLTGMYFKTIKPLVWKDKDTSDCLNQLVRRSLLTRNNADQLYKFHQLVKSFFKHIERQNEQELFPTAFLRYLLFELSSKHYSLKQHHQLLVSPFSVSPQFVLRFYKEANMMELSNSHNRRTIPRQIFSNHSLNMYQIFDSTSSLVQVDKINTLYMKWYSFSLFNSFLSHTYALLLNLQSLQSEYLTEYGSLKYFTVYVTNLINLARLQTHAHNSTFALKTLHQKSSFETVTKLFYAARMDNTLESHGFYADYYAALATKYIRLKDFDSFMECWQQLLYLKVYKMKCEIRPNICTSIQHGLAAFGRRNYHMVLSLLRPHLYSRMVPLHKRAQLFVLVHFSYVKLNQLELAERLLTYDFSRDVEFDRVPHCMFTQCDYHESVDARVFPYHTNSITDEFLGVQFAITDDAFLNSQKNCRALMIFGTLLEKHGITTEMRVLGIWLQDKAAKFVRFYLHIFLHTERKHMDL